MANRRLTRAQKIAIEAILDAALTDQALIFQPVIRSADGNKLHFRTLIRTVDRTTNRFDTICAVEPKNKDCVYRPATFNEAIERIKTEFVK